MRVVVTGATGYIGGRLVPELLDRGHEVVCAVRTPAKLAGRAWSDHVEVAEIDVFEPATLEAAFAGADAVYFLVHSMDGGDDFAERDRTAAANVRDAAASAGVGRIVYLGGLGEESDDLSEHLRSRHEVGRVLAGGPVPVTELRAAIIIGSGSASFEMLRHLVEVLPVMVTPRWVDTRCQPIAIRDVLGHLCEVLDRPDTAGRVVEVGGPDVLTYRELMHVYAEVAGLRRRVIVPVPVLTPRLSSLWIGLVTPLPTGLARPLVDSLVNEVVVRDDESAALLPPAQLSFRAAVELALQRIQDLEVATTWASAGPARSSRPAAQPAVTTEAERRTATTEVEDGAAPPEDPLPEDPSWAGGTVLTDRRRVRSTAPPEVLFDTVRRIGGPEGYHSARLLWEVRGVVDKLVGGIGLRRGRRHPFELAVGEVVDFWRVEAFEPPRLLRLRAEMRVPGEAWLEYRVVAFPDGTSGLEQRARFHPRGLWGRMYWGAMLPFHALIFPRMARQLARAAERAAAGPGTPATASAPAPAPEDTPGATGTPGTADAAGAADTPRPPGTAA
jgi:uncharacterized protein YbjT (DUF2867 family)